ncbi:GNAT family N-acetyltransferase [Aeoliella mucimassa]|uniref:Putative acetyltransferase n=1 Tax=Aeoliella mucimassa TaxID=2527972 RepID=A0A518AJ12_9BACT|nr:GNAT family N-acetyltransferase [Aeoliella mucimassa]QDU54664.1 putative acetyltransferase [Aeoliella mucimassa]
MSEITIRQVDLANPKEVEALVAMIDAYAQHEMGGGRPLPTEVREVLGERFAAHPASLAWIAWLDDQPVGGLVAFWCFSTFSARSRINIHDISVVDGHRNQGIGRKLIEAVEDYARRTDCCSITLEVRGDNLRGRHLYQKCGFQGPTDWSPPESMVFWKKSLS